MPQLSCTERPCTSLETQVFMHESSDRPPRATLLAIVVLWIWEIFRITHCRSYNVALLSRKGRAKARVNFGSQIYHSWGCACHYCKNEDMSTWNSADHMLHNLPSKYLPLQRSQIHLLSYDHITVHLAAFVQHLGETQLWTITLRKLPHFVYPAFTEGAMVVSAVRLTRVLNF
jgi:hypothetical protein